MTNLSSSALIVSPKPHKFKEFFSRRRISHAQIAVTCGFSAPYVTCMLNGSRPFSGELSRRITNLVTAILAEEKKAEGLPE